MSHHPISLNTLYERLSSPMVAEATSVVSGELAEPWLLVDLPGSAMTAVAAKTPTAMPGCPVVGLVAAAAVAHRPASMSAVPAVIDVLVTAEDCAALLAAIAANPQAATVLVQTLRAAEGLPIDQALIVESLAYSTLQHGAEFQAWLAGRPPAREPVGNEEPLLVHRAVDELAITLNRPAQRNAYSAALRDALCAALEIAVLDSTIQQVTLRGAGPAFCAGGDLTEFGQARDAAFAHLLRTQRSAAPLLAQLAPRVQCELQGACVGAGIELPAYAAQISARADAFFQLPEVSMGLVPGAGGTVSISRRIGRLRTAYMALSGARIDARTALDWGLIDALLD